MLDEIEDTVLVKQAQEGNLVAIGALYDRYYLHIFRYMCSRVSPAELAEDLTGELFYRMVTHLPKYRFSEAPFRAWLYRIAHNLVVDHYRLAKPQEKTSVIDTSHLIDPHTPEQMLEETLNSEQVQLALTKIDPTQGDVLSLRFLLGLSLQETAEVLEKSVAAVKSLQHRGLSALKGVLYQMEVMP